MRLEVGRYLLVIIIGIWCPILSQGAENEATTCSSDTFQCKREISVGYQCIPLNWVCDGDHDCPDGDDEKANCSIPTCASWQFTCTKGAARCITQGYICDGEEDCTDGSDETPEVCKNRMSKGSHIKGEKVDNFKCLPNHYQCPGTHHCIPLSSVCDSITDCADDAADEGAHCVNHGCRKLNCSYLCKETLQGPMCYCRNGFAPDAAACQDFNECQVDDFCDQACTNLQGSYMCNCSDGYTLQKNGYCKADNSSSATLLISDYRNVIQIKLDGSDLSPAYKIGGDQILALDYDLKNSQVCWITFEHQNGTTNLKCADLKDSSKQWTIPTQYKLSSVDQIAKDWVSGNWYFVDGKKERIFLCKADGLHCLTVISTEMRRPKSIAIDSTRGLMFYADWSLQAKIVRAELDGRNRKNITTSKIVHPNGITLDYVNKHVYWGDSFLNIIERVDYEGNGRKTISQGLNIRQRYGLTLFENFLYVSNHQVNNNSVVRIHRYNSSVTPVIVHSGLLKPGALQVAHAVRQPGSTDLCKKKACEQICIPVPDGLSVKAKCVCRAGFTPLPDNDTKCHRNNATTFLLYANAQQGSIHGISINPSTQSDVMEPIENLNRPIALAYHAASRYIYYSDVSLLQIGRRKVDEASEKAEHFLDAGVTSCEGLAIDWVGNNLYWTDDGLRTISVVRLNNRSMSYTIQIENLNHPKAIAVDPNEGYMYWTDWVLRPSEIKPKIEKSTLDGENRVVLVDKSIQWPNSLTLDSHTKRLYWTDAYFDRIESIGIDGSERKTLLSFHSLKHPYGIAVYQNLIFWTESLSGWVEMHNTTSNTTQQLRMDSTPLFDLIIVNVDTQQIKDGAPCAKNNGMCSDICISLPNDHVCKCGKGRLITSDNKTCEDIPDYTPPSACDENFKFECKDGSCINKRFLCDGDQDCNDGSDEDISKDGVCGNISCPDPSMFSCSNKRCIYMQFVCDGEADCTDGSDEKSDLCHQQRACPQNYSLCTENGRCIPESWKCDHEKDCPDGSDEGVKCGYDNCEIDQFRCHDGRCIPYVYRCDNEYDCSDHSDESDCGQWCDPDREFKCKDSGECLPLIYRCDHEQNCKDGSDEQNCDNPCKDSEFHCNSSDCINRSWRCDGDEDCVDGSDEWGCNMDLTHSCHPSQEFLCKDKSRCIPKSWQCDRDNDCVDKSDELDCSYISPCEAPKFTCKNNTNICFPPEKLCDDHVDCPDHSDEGRLCAYNMCANHDCSHICHKSPDGFVCSCPKHKRLRADNRTCFDIDICEHWGICSQNCSSSLDGYQCLCYKGYNLADDFYSCKPNDGVPIYIIYSNRHEIRRYDLGDQSFVSLVSGLRNTIAVDFYYDMPSGIWIFWTDVVDDKIYRGRMISSTLTNIEAIIDVGLATTEGLAIDWVAKNIYWVESNLDQIEVAKLDGTNRSTLIAGNMTSPRAIVLDPREGALFWTDWDGSDPRIEGCSMSGENRHTIYDIKRIPTGGWPNGLAVDYEERRLYWIDARSDSVHTILYSGEGHHLVIQSHESLAHPFALTMFEHHIYWTDWSTNSLVMGSKFNNSGVEIIQRTFTQPFDLQILHPKRQPHVDNPCKDNGGCSHLCLIGVNHTPHCKCPHRMKLLADKKSCESDNKFLLFVKENEIRGVDLDNGHYNVIPSITVPFVENATTIDYDVQEDRLYWTDIKRNVIRSAFINGTGIETIIDSGISNPRGFAIDWVSRNMYFSSYDETKKEAAISVAKLNGAFRTKVVSSDSNTGTIKLIKPTSIAIHPSEGLLFWCDTGGENHMIVQAKMDGSNARVIVQDAASPASLSVDIASNILYWISLKKKTVNMYDLTKSQIKETPMLNMTSIMSMTMYGEIIYLANSNNIIKINRKTQEVKTIRDKTPHVYAMQIYDPSSRQNGTNACSLRNGGCTQMCLPTGKMSQICKCTAGFNINTIDNKTCDGIQSFMLYSTESEIRGFSLDEKDRDALAPVSKISLASAIDFHAVSDYIYWVDSNSQSISRIKRDLTDRQKIIKDIHGVEGMAIDWISGSVYWTDRGHDMIGVSKLNGSNRYIVMHGDMEKPRSICLHPVLGFMFFGDWGAKPKIVQARLDGSDRKDFISTNIKAPFGLTVDYDTNHLYWCDKDLDVIEKVDIMSGKRKVLVQKLADCMALTIFEKHIYWADATLDGGSIRRADTKHWCGSHNISIKSGGTGWEESESWGTGWRESESWGTGWVESESWGTGWEESESWGTGWEESESWGTGWRESESWGTGWVESESWGTGWVESESWGTGWVESESLNHGALVGGNLNHGALVGGNLNHGALVGGNLNHGALAGWNLNHGALAGWNLNHGALAGWNLNHGALVGWNLNHGALVGWNLNHGALVGWNLNHGALVGRNLNHGALVGWNLNHGALAGWNLNHGALAGWNLNHGALAGWNLNHGALVGGNLNHGALVGGNLNHGALVGWNLNHGALAGWNLNHGALAGWNLNHGALAGWNLNHGALVGGNLNHGALVGWNLNHGALVGGNLNHGALVGGNLNHGALVGWNLNHGALAGWNLNHGALAGWNLNHGALAGWNLNHGALVGGNLNHGPLMLSSVTGTNRCKHDNGGCAELCLFRGNMERTCACSYGNLAPDNTTCEDYDAFLLYSEVTAIASIQMNSYQDVNAPLEPVVNETHMKNVIGLTFNHRARRIFYSDIQRGDIQAVLFDGTHFEVLVDNVGAAEGLAFDSTNHYLYWTSYTNSSISRIGLHPDIAVKNRKQETIIQLSMEDHPRAIVIDLCKSRMFWTNWNDHKPCIQTSMLNGYNAHTIIDKHIRTPNGLTIDHRAQKLYWTDARLDKIERCNFDGTNRDVIVTAIPQHSFGIAVYGDFIYWTDWMLRAVLRANKYDGSGLKWLRKGIQRQPMGIIAVANDTDDCTLNPCYMNAFGCEDECTVNDKGKPQCNCTKEHPVLLPDGKRCAVTTFKCSITDFLCEDRFRCIPIEKTCNSIIDCPDGSDEMKQLCSQPRKCPAGFFSCNNSRCVSYNKTCDGHNDCDDDSDEVDCPCKVDEFRCTSGMCIQQKYRCDRDGDCPDLSDEMGCNLTCSDVEIEGEPLEGLISCNTTSACIYPSWKCDGSNDCWDRSDEANCSGTGEMKCPQEAFKCESGSCIPKHWVCDKDNDCGDSSDEANCTYNCDKDYIACTNDSTCIPSTWQCDGHEDCHDGSDEVGCGNHTCRPDEFQCPTGRCIPSAWKCDQDSDCDDASDEKNTDECPPVVCEPDEFLCLNRRCIKSIYYCNGDNDCGDNSDEPDMCVLDVCGEHQFKCANRGKCIPDDQRCNGLFDCPDHSDEDNCTVSPPCGTPTQFKCQNGVCISEDLVCNGHNDCGDKSDEPLECGINECFGISRPHICTQNCTDKKIGYVCSCYNGYKLLNDSKTCVDIDECDVTYPCSHNCINTIGSYFCSCPKGLDYKLDGNHRTCKVTKKPWPVLLVSNRYYLRNVTIPKGETSHLTDKLTNSVAIDFDWQDKYIYWSDITSHSSSINRMHFDHGNDRTVEVLHSTTVRNPDGIAVDWVARNLYWCDKTTDTIEVSKLHGVYRKVLIRQGLQEPRGLEVFPAKGLLYFTDWGDQPNIGRIWMDGTHRQTIIKDNLAWPNALTIDYMTEHIFWADASLDYIAMARLDGSGRRIVVSNIHYVPHVFGLSVFEDHIYWTDWEKMGIYYTNKFSGNKITKLVLLVHRPMDLQVLHPYRQLPMNASVNGGYNPCENNGGCSHLCLLHPVLKYNRIASICACPENHYLAADKKTCISNCTSAQFLCNATSKCIPFWWKCDNHTDCEDSSDEPPTCRRYYCSQPGLFQCDNAKSAEDCYLPTVICDGTAKCSDNSDEKNCDVYSCMEHQFKCHSNSTCISKALRCNSHNDCMGGEDEADCPTTTCNPNQFNCSNGRCVPYVWRCDHDNDCGDWSDEPENCTQLSCKDDHIKCEKSGRCIPKAWTCDGDPDCGEDDNSDEKQDECQHRTCSPTYFKCSNGHCIPGRWKCDYYDDCRDGSDEIGCTLRNCSESEMMCANHKCIQKSLQCNGEVNCEDGSDEIHCNTSCNPGTEFQCKKVKHCIPIRWKCDGDTDCADGTDEWDCDRNCTNEEFRCNNSICQPLLWKCDGDNDCGDGSDENPEMCAHSACPPSRFRCKNNFCIWSSLVCDGNTDCADGSDEINCPIKEKCNHYDFKCTTAGPCIPIALVCDNVTHCSNGADENTTMCDLYRLNCSVNHGGCEQKCTPHGCRCEPGFELMQDGFACKAINPCRQWGVCSQKCSHDNQHAVSCYCEKGFKSAPSFKKRDSCVAVGDAPRFLVAEESLVLTVSMSRSSDGNLSKPLPGYSEENDIHVVAMDVDTTGDEWIVFMVVENNGIWSVRKENIVPKTEKRSRRDADTSESLWFGHQKIKSLALDWVLHRIYWMDATTKSIQLRNYDGKQHMHIVEGDMNSPNSVAVDPESGKLFWTDQGLPPKIESANLDGLNRTLLVTTELMWPNGIVVDHANGWVYWCDTKKYTIETMDLYGNGRRIVQRFPSSHPPYTLQVFGDYLYVLTSKTWEIIKMHKFGDESLKLQPMYTGINRVFDLVVMQKHKLKTSITNNCNAKKNPCNTSMCFNNPWGVKGFTCRCPKDATIENNKCSFQKVDNPCMSFKCKHNGNCSLNIHDKPKCSCTSRFTGDHCQIDRCENYCLNQGTCIVSSSPTHPPTCRCPVRYRGNKCEIYRCSNYCKNGGLCSVNSDGKPICQCPIYFEGLQCENNKTITCDDLCERDNWKSCASWADRLDEPKCSCKPGFKGLRCEQCDDLFCYHEGICKRSNNKPYCICKENYDTSTNCMDYSCKYLCSLTMEYHGDCNCKSLVGQCLNYCKNHGKCSVKDDNKAVCDCGKLFTGDRCETCRCEPGGTCSHISQTQTICTCKEGYKGPLCDAVDSPISSGSKDNLMMYVIIPVVVSIVVVIMIIIIVFCRRRHRLQQYGHKRMKDNSMNVKNPIYLRHESGLEDQETGQNLIFRGDASTNFANPMYDVYNGENMPILMQQDNEQNELLEDGLAVKYFGTDIATSKKTSVA
ncbi:low-density lipoprotein receptor-related protein 1-like [Gigantopelta aegis]|uniref:low-density lipoprotein receptor-related protein 1-like n=1 Tax=Gigantopelta aegis TaxID=1735272 RepID=UPI001B88903D|nr:low-density lipoprotein receptor-related protein 1-like [Gigantopelta aegis]